MKIKFYCVLAILIIFTPNVARAGVCNGLLGIAGPVISLSTLSFGNYDASAISDNTANTTITVTCTILTGNALPSFSIALSAGGGSFTTRQMTFLTSKLNYNIYTTSALTTVWGDGTGNTATQSYNTSSNNNSQAFVAFGDIPKKQFVPTGLYGDAIAVTITY